MRTGTPSLRETDSACRCHAIEERDREKHLVSNSLGLYTIANRKALQETHGDPSEILSRASGIADDQYPAGSKGFLQVFPSVLYRGV
jgi:hypothetical protein